MQFAKLFMADCDVRPSFRPPVSCTTGIVAYLRHVCQHPVLSEGRFLLSKDAAVHTSVGGRMARTWKASDESDWALMQRII